jgi:hypothetical protein
MNAAAASALPNPLAVSAAEVEELTDPWADVEMPADVRLLLAVCQRCANCASEAAGGQPRRVRVVNERLFLALDGQEWIYSDPEAVAELLRKGKEAAQ